MSREEEQSGCDACRWAEETKDGAAGRKQTLSYGGESERQKEGMADREKSRAWARVPPVRCPGHAPKETLTPELTQGQGRHPRPTASLNAVRWASGSPHPGPGPEKQRELQAEKVKRRQKRKREQRETKMGGERQRGGAIRKRNTQRHEQRSVVKTGQVNRLKAHTGKKLSQSS